MKAFLRWLAKIAGSTITVILVIVLFPYVSRLAEKFLPDESGSAIKASVILAANLQESARLETLKVEEDGVLNYDIRAAFIGSVSNVNISYKYEASFGIDLSKVTMEVSGNTIVFTLPRPEVIQDALTPKEVYHDDFWYKGFTFEDYEKLLESERLARRSAYLSGEDNTQLWDETVRAFENTIEQWLKNVNGNLNLRYVEAQNDAQN